MQPMQQYLDDDEDDDEEEGGLGGWGGLDKPRLQGSEFYLRTPPPISSPIPTLHPTHACFLWSADSM